MVNNTKKTFDSILNNNNSNSVISLNILRVCLYLDCRGFVFFSFLWWLWWWWLLTGFNQDIERNCVRFLSTKYQNRTKKSSHFDLWNFFYIFSRVGVCERERVCTEKKLSRINSAYTIHVALFSNQKQNKTKKKCWTLQFLFCQF